MSGAGGSLGLTLRAWPTLWRVAVADIVAYRAEMVIWILSATLPLDMITPSLNDTTAGSVTWIRPAWAFAPL